MRPRRGEIGHSCVRAMCVWTGTTVTTTFAGEDLSTEAAADGVWRIALPPTQAGGPHDLTFVSSLKDEPPLHLRDVLFGDVYVCGGQSNMQFSVGANVNGSAYAAEAAAYPHIRLLTVGDGVCRSGASNA